ncbi:dermonecrotic toxin domain-containing protein [Pseudomonas sp. 18173]|uniref:dermonecrotic toxin domain-containing protein n=1 Tax=Pseudomonas sp. 18173 TaxID=3390055 RepID=UPI003D1CDE69
MNDPLRDHEAPPHPALHLRDELKTAVATALPQTPEQFGAQLIREKWGQDIDPDSALLVTLDYDTDASAGRGAIHQGRVNNSRTLVQAMLSNYQTVADGRFGETAFGLYTPPDIGPEIHVVGPVDDAAAKAVDYYHDYEGIYRSTTPQTYGPSTQIALRPADFKKWVWELDLQSRYQACLEQAWPSAERIVRAEPYALRTSVKAAFVMSACLQHQEGSLSQAGLALAMQAAGLPAEQTWEALVITQLQAPTRVGTQIEAGRLTIYRYTSSDIWFFRQRSSARALLYIPANSSPLHEFADIRHMRDWVVAQGRIGDTQQALASHFAEEDRDDGTFHAGVLTALEGLAAYPNEYRLKKTAGFFNDDGFWDPQDYIDFERSSAATDPFAQLVLTMRQASMASVKTIRDDAQVNRDNLSAVVEPLVRWINRFGPLALFVPGGEGLLVLAAIIDAGYGLDQAVNGKTPEQRSEGITRTVFGLLNALPLAGAGAALKGEGSSAKALGETLDESGEPIREPGAHPLPEVTIKPEPAPATPVTRLELMRSVCTPLAAFSDEVLGQIARISSVDDDLLRSMQAGHPLTPLLADTISRFQLEQTLETVADPVIRAQMFDSRYQALQQSDSEWVRLFLREYPGLPKSVVEQILDRSGVEIARPVEAAEALRMIKRLDGKAREYQSHARLNRAFEGLYLKTVHQPDSDILALHSIRQLPGWPEHLRIEVLKGTISGRVLDRCGPLDSPDCRRLVRVEGRYRHSAMTDSVEGEDMFAALFGVLSADERAAMSLHSSSELRRRIGEWALPRSELMLGLNRMDSGLPFEASGLRGGGYPHTPQGADLTHEVKRLLVKDLYPDFTDAQADELLDRAGGGAEALLESLRLQLQQLRSDLSSWIDQAVLDVDDMDLDFLAVGDEDAAGMNPQQVEAHNVGLLQRVIEYERESRDELADKLIAIWQKCPPHVNNVYSNEVFAGYRLDLGFEDFHRLPVMNIHFDEVIELSLQGFHLVERESLNAFLESFPNLRSLDLERVDLRHLNAEEVLEGVLPPAIRRMTRLTSLNLRSTFLELKENTASQFLDLVNLQMLDLSDNPLVTPPLVLGLNELRVLNLRNTRISHCPIGIADEPYLTSLDLRDNQISRVPEAVLNQAISRGQVKLWGNPLTDEDTLVRLVEHRERTGINLWLGEPGAQYGSAIPWLKEGDELLRAARNQIWQRLALKSSGAVFLRVMDGLSLTAQFRVGYWLLQARVWRLLCEADASEELWGWLRQTVETTLADAQDPFRLFGALEDKVQLYRDWVGLGRPIRMGDHPVP